MADTRYSRLQPHTSVSAQVQAKIRDKSVPLEDVARLADRAIAGYMAHGRRTAYSGNLIAYCTGERHKEAVDVYFVDEFNAAFRSR